MCRFAQRRQATVASFSPSSLQLFVTTFIPSSLHLLLHLLPPEASRLLCKWDHRRSVGTQVGQNSRLMRAVACHLCVHFAACQHPERYFHTSDVKRCPKEEGEKRKDVLHVFFLCRFCKTQRPSSCRTSRYHTKAGNSSPSVSKFFMGVNSAEGTDVLIREKHVNPA